MNRRSFGFDSGDPRAYTSGNSHRYLFLHGVLSACAEIIQAYQTTTADPSTRGRSPPTAGRGVASAGHNIFVPKPALSEADTTRLLLMI